MEEFFERLKNRKPMQWTPLNDAHLPYYWHNSRRGVRAESRPAVMTDGEGLL